MNPADYIIDVLLDPNRADFTTLDITKLDFTKSFLESEDGAHIERSIEHCKSGYQDLSGMAEHAKPFAVGIPKTFGMLAQRHFRNQLRSPVATVVSMIQAVALAFIIGSIFYQLGYEAPAVCFVNTLINRLELLTLFASSSSRRSKDVLECCFSSCRRCILMCSKC